jgi:hypothetical protein
MEIKKSNNCETIEEVYACLKTLEEETRQIRNPADIDALEQEIMNYTNRLAALLLKKKSK